MAKVKVLYSIDSTGSWVPGPPYTIGILCLKFMGKICTPNVPWVVFR